MTAAFRCGHERTPENTRRAGIKPSGEPKLRCKLCHDATRGIYSQACMQRYREKDRAAYNAYQAAWKLAYRRKRGATHREKARNAVAPRITPYRGQIVPSRTPPEWKTLKRDPFHHAKLAMLTRQ